MKRIIALAAAFAMTLALSACTGGTLGIESDDTGVHVQATGSAEGSGTGTISIGDGEGLCINHIVEKGSFHVKATDSAGNVVFDQDITDNIADMVDVQGDFDIVISAKDAQGTIDIIAYDKEAQARADSTLDDALKQVTGSGAEERGVSRSSVTWTGAQTADEAARGAGIDGFAVPESGTKVSIGELGDWEYCFAPNMAEADGYAAAASVVVRKGLGNGDNTGEPSDYTKGWDLSSISYKNEWNEDMGGVDVRCYGNVEGTISKAIWAIDEYSYSVLVLGQGDAWYDFGLPADDIAAIVGATK